MQRKQPRVNSARLETHSTLYALAMGGVYTQGVTGLIGAKNRLRPGRSWGLLLFCPCGWLLPRSLAYPLLLTESLLDLRSQATG